MNIEITKAKGRSDEWYTPAFRVETIDKYLPKMYTVWCPFDTSESYFVKILGEKRKVIYSHIDDGQDFFTYTPDEPYDCIVSNPPYSLRDDIYKRLFSIGKPFAMLMNFSGIFDSKKRYDLFSKNGVQLLIPQGRTKFFNDYSNPVSHATPAFQTVYVCWRLLDRDIVFAD